MNRRRRALVRLAIAALLLAPGLRAPAEDFEFAVPVSVSKLDASFVQGKVSCKVYGPTRLDSVAESRSQGGGTYGVIGSGESTFPISRGAYEGTVGVKFFASRSGEAAGAQDYSCALSLLTGNSVTTFCVINVGVKQISSLALNPQKIAASHGCTTGRVPLSPKP